MDIDHSHNIGNPGWPHSFATRVDKSCRLALLTSLFCLIPKLAMTQDRVDSDALQIPFREILG